MLINVVKACMTNDPNKRPNSEIVSNPHNHPVEFHDGPRLNELHRRTPNLKPNNKNEYLNNGAKRLKAKRSRPRIKDE